MTPPEIISRIQELTHKLNDLNDAYHKIGFSSLSDFEYDALLQELVLLEKTYPEFALPNSPTQKVGSLGMTGELVPLSHQMYSLANTYSLEDTLKWMGSFDPSLTFFVDGKVDGIAISLKYVDGSLIKATTRGDGTVGVDITPLALSISNIPNTVQDNLSFEIDGELFINHSDFEAVNYIQNQKNARPYANLRSAVSGMARSEKHGQEFRYLKFKPYWIDISTETHVQRVELFEDLGFLTHPYILVSTKDYTALEKLYAKYQKDLPEFPIDGLVVRINDVRIEKDLGYTKIHAKFAKALKFKDPEKSTVVTSTKWSISRYGVFSPVVYIDPVEFDGVTIEKVAVANVQQLEKLNVYTGCVVSIARSASVIPIIKSVTHRPNSGKVRVLEKCPHCHSRVRYSGPKLYCNNQQCPGAADALLRYIFQHSLFKAVGFRTDAIEIFVRYKCTSIFKLLTIPMESLLPSRYREDYIDARTSILKKLASYDKAMWANVLAMLNIKSLTPTVIDKIVNGVDLKVETKNKWGILTDLRRMKVAGVSPMTAQSIFRDCLARQQEMELFWLFITNYKVGA